LRLCTYRHVGASKMKRAGAFGVPPNGETG
jgi:hypothetical protein